MDPVRLIQALLFNIMNYTIVRTKRTRKLLLLHLSMQKDVEELAKAMERSEFAQYALPTQVFFRAAQIQAERFSDKIWTEDQKAAMKESCRLLLETLPYAMSALGTFTHIRRHVPDGARVVMSKVSMFVMCIDRVFCVYIPCLLCVLTVLFVCIHRVCYVY